MVHFNVDTPISQLSASEVHIETQSHDDMVPQRPASQFEVQVESIEALPLKDSYSQSSPIEKFYQ